MIRGYFDPTPPTTRPQVPGAVFLPGFSKSPVIVHFTLDTGADRTCLHPLDSLRLGITPRQLRTPELWSGATHVRGIGGAVAYYETTALVSLLHEDRGEWQILEIPVDVAPILEETMSLPSLLGWDILQHFRLELDWATRHIALH